MEWLLGLLGLGILAAASKAGAAVQLGPPRITSSPGGPPTYPRALSFVPARYQGARGSSRVRYVVIHITDGGADYRGTVEYFRTMPDNREVSAHYVVGRGGEVVECVRPDDGVAWHAHAINPISVGIEHSARAPKEQGPTDAGLLVTSAQYQASAELARWLCDRYGLPFDRRSVVGHAEIDKATTHSDCPTGAWSWAEFAAAARPLGWGDLNT